jgi:hypothetical protein
MDEGRCLAAWTSVINRFYKLSLKQFITNQIPFLYVSHMKTYKTKSDIEMKNVHVDSKGFWRWCITFRITGFVDSVHRLEILITRKQNVSETESVSILRWGRETPTLLGTLERANLILLDKPCQNQSRKYVTTDGQLASLSWCQAPFWGPGPDFYYVNCGPVDVGRPVWFTIAAGPHQHSHSRPRVYRATWPYFTVSDSRFS